METETFESHDPDWSMVGAESFYLCEGSASLKVHQQELILKKGDVALIPRGTRYQFAGCATRLRIRSRAFAPNQSVDQYAYQVLQASCRWAGDHHFVLPLNRSKRSGFAKKIMACAEDTKPLSRRSAMFALIAFLESVLPPELFGKHKAGSPAIMREFIRYLSTHFEEPISVADALRITGLGRSQFHVAFRQATGTTFQQYLLQYRVGEASLMLRHSKLSILDIAYSCGFSSPSWFYKVFRKQIGVTPERYRHSNPKVSA